VIRDGERCSLSSKDVVPGDVVVLKPGYVPCDMVILDSKHLLVDESALTGESNPVFKSELDVNMSKIEYDENGFKQCTIFCGTTIIETGEGEKDLGLVVATGSFTKKGQLLSDILSYQRHKFQFDDEIVPVLCILLAEAAVLVTLIYKFLGDQYVFSWFYAMFVIATIFPPLLPTVFVIAVGISAERLEKKRITCTNPQGILIAGKVNVCCFDKTGTLTEAGMNASGVESHGNEYLAKQTKLGMCVCHNLQLMSTGEIIGNEVDKASFEYTGATINTEESRGLEIKYDGEKYVILKQNLFDNVLVTQSVIVELPNKKQVTFVKGSAEAIRALCRPETIPSSFDDTLRDGSKDGLYLLAMGFKELSNDTLTKTDGDDDVELRHMGNPTMMPRTELESSLTFCGFIKFENVLKAETRGVMEDLKAGNILITMITGDNVLTGIRMAREAGICTAETTILARKVDKSSIEWINVDAEQAVSQPYEMSKSFDLAVTGEAWFHLLNEEPEYAKLIAKYIRVFGRCNPAHKVSVVSTFVEQGYITLMCGDGQNDCGAIKSAHVGVALSTADASVVAPFTSLDLTLSSVTEILREGRCSLSSALKVYCYFMLYGQLCSILQVTNAYFATTFNGWAWIFVDGAIPVLIAFSLPLSKAANKLSACRPTASLFGPRTLSTMCGILGWNIIYLFLAYYLLFQQDWFQCRKWDGTDVSGQGEIQDNYETIVTYLVGGYQLVSTGLALCFGYTFRDSWYKNYWFVVLFVFFSVIHFTITLRPSKLSCAFRVNCSEEVRLTKYISSLFVCLRFTHMRWCCP
jgi:predicted P-type ATPase